VENRDEINLLELLIVILRRKRLILGMTFASALISVIISLILTPIYRAETRIMPPQSSVNNVAAQLMGQLGEFGSLAGGMIGEQTSNALYINLLKSRTILDSIIDKFDLMKLYEEEYRQDARKELLDNLIPNEDKKSGVISVAVEDKDPQRAADMANSFIQELKKLTKGLAISKAAQRRLFYEEQMVDAKDELMKVEEQMKGFQEKTGVLHIEEQAKAIIEGIAELKAEIVAKEVEIRAMRAFITENNPELQAAEEALKGMKMELSKIESKEGKMYDPLMPTGRMPEVGTEYLRKLRDLKYNETLYEILVKQYELAKLDEGQDAVIIQVVDEAIPPEKRAKPRRVLMVIFATFSAFALSILIAFFVEYMKKTSVDPQNKDMIEEIRKHAIFYKNRS